MIFFLRGELLNKLTGQEMIFLKIYLPYLSSKEFQKDLSLSRQPLPNALSKKGFRFLNQAP